MNASITDIDRSEWARMAQAAYNVYRSDIGHRFSVAASRSSMDLATYDRLQTDYRAWLMFGLWPVSPAHRAAIRDAQAARRPFHWVPQTAPQAGVAWTWSAHERLSYVGID
jgi:hypothetical protein